MSIKVPAGKSLAPVPNSERLGGELPEHYAKQVDLDAKPDQVDLDSKANQSDLDDTEIFAFAGMVM